MIVGLAQMNIKWNDPVENKEKCQKFFCEARDKGVELLVFPEMTLTGFNVEAETVFKLNNGTMIFFRKMAIKYHMNVIFGMVDSACQTYKNKCIAISNTGEILGEYTKIHSFSFAGEDKEYNSGDDIVNFNVNEFNISTFICYDLRFPEIFQVASNKSKLIIIIANWPIQRREHWNILLRARAIENQAFVIGVNRVGDDLENKYIGDSQVVSPDGKVKCSLIEKEGLIIANIQLNDVEEYRRKFRVKADRKNLLYSELLQKN